MKYRIFVHQEKAIELGVKNINQAHIFDLLISTSTWAETEIVDKEVYYWIARQKICDELVLLRLKPDTVYRHLKGLNTLGLINYIKIGKKDCINITKKGKKYLLKGEETSYVGSKSENNSNSETNPSKLENKSESNSETNPPDTTTISHPSTKDTLPAWLDLDTWKDWIAYKKERKEKLTSISIKKQLKLLGRNKDVHVQIIDKSIQNGWSGLFELDKSMQPAQKKSGWGA